MAAGGPAYDVVIVGGGSAGCVLASRLSDDPARSIALIEAGPDYGPWRPDGLDHSTTATGEWPVELLDATADARVTHDWGYDGGPSASRARVIGGCSSHNGCISLAGSRSDYDEWVDATGDSGWSYERLRPRFARVARRMRVHVTPKSRVTPVTRAFFSAAAEIGLEEIDFDDPDQETGFGRVPLNVRGRFRWNAAFAYLDPVRDRRNLSILDRTLVDRVEFEGGRAIAVAAIRDGERLRIAAGTVILAAGAYATPAILQRSGVGAAPDLTALGIPIVRDLPGVGAGLMDHPYVTIAFAAKPALAAANARHLARTTWFGVGQVKGRSALCTPGTWDFTIPPWSGAVPRLTEGSREVAGMNPIAMKTVSRGSVRLRSRDPGVSPIIDHGFLRDPDGHDLAVLASAARASRRLGATRAWKRYAGAELSPGPGVGDGEDLLAWIRQTVAATYHPCGTCRMGRADDALAVVDAAGAVRGLDGLAVIDASILPTIPSVNIHLPVLAIADRLAEVWAR